MITPLTGVINYAIYIYNKYADWHIGVSGSCEPFSGQADDVQSTRQHAEIAWMTYNTRRQQNDYVSIRLLLFRFQTWDGTISLLGSVGGAARSSV